MSGKVKLSLRVLDINLKVKTAHHIINCMSGNKNFPEPSPPLSDLVDTVRVLEHKFAELQQQRQLIRKKSIELRTAESDLDKKLTMIASYVESRAKGDAGIITGAGMEVRAENAPLGIPARVRIKSVKESVNFGEIKINWEKVRGAKVYNIELSDNVKIDSCWKIYESTTKTKILINHLKSGTKYWFRVQAIGSAGRGAYSDPVFKYAP